MALLAKPGFPYGQHARLIGAVGIMAVGAIFPDRLMFPQERTAFFGMTLVTDLVNGVFSQLMRAGGTMGIMTIGTDDLALHHRMMRAFVEVGPFVR